MSWMFRGPVTYQVPWNLHALAVAHALRLSDGSVERAWTLPHRLGRDPR